MQFDAIVKTEGCGDIIIENRGGPIYSIPGVTTFKNRVVDLGREAMAKSIANQFGGVYEYWINTMVFGSGGTSGGTPRYVDASRNGLFGPTVASKAVISTLNPSIPSQVVFTSVLLFDDAVGSTVNEMGMRMRNGDFFSLTTFGDISKTADMQITINWKFSWL